MKQYVGLVILEHLRHELDVHVLDIDLLVEHQRGLQPDRQA